jgi:hypothetical protein
MSNYPIWAKEHPNAPYNQQPDPIDQQMVDMATQDLKTVLERVKDSNGNFPDKFHRLIDELLTIKFEK